MIPPVIEKGPRGILLDAHFANNLASYLEHFDQVTVACPSMQLGAEGALALENFEEGRVSVLPLPTPYREDRYFRHRSEVATQLRSEIANADYLLFSPHSAFDWSTLAAKLAISMGRSFDMEADWDLENVWAFQIAQMPFGPRKVRKQLWLWMQMRAYKYCMSRSSLSLLQGQDVFDAYRNIAPNPHKVLNVQITGEDLIDKVELARKAERAKSGAKLKIVYAGRVSPMKGPYEWLTALAVVADAGIDFEASWFGGGELLKEVRSECERLGLSDRASFSGPRPRAEVLSAVEQAHIFLFCHKTKESPRCVVEALACGTPIVGFDSGYVRDLVQRGGGAFVELGNASALGELVLELNADRGRLAAMMEQSRASAELFDRDRAIERRIELIKTFISPGKRTQVGQS